MLYLGIRPPKAAFFSFRMQPMNDPLLPSSGHSKNIFILIVFVFLPGGRNLPLKHATFSMNYLYK